MIKKIYLIIVAFLPFQFLVASSEHSELVPTNSVIEILVQACLLLLFFLLLYSSNQKIKNAVKFRKDSLELSTITNTINIGVVVFEYCDNKLKPIFVNDGFTELVRFSRQELSEKYKKDPMSILHPEDINVFMELLQLFKDSKQKISVKLKIKQKNNGYINILLNGTFVNKKTKTEIYCALIDISYQERVAQQLRLEQNRYKLFIETTNDMYYDINIVSGKVYCSSGIAKEFGNLMPEKYSSQSFFNEWKIHKDFKTIFLNTMQDCIENNKRSEIKIKICKKNDIPIWCQVSINPIYEREVLVQILGKIENIDESEKEKEAMRLQAQTDGLTGLYRKTTFISMAQTYLDTLHAEKSALVFIDLDNFKQINDTFGHLYGDNILKDVAEKLRIIFSNYDIISRFGGDEFCVLVKKIPIETLEKKLSWMLEKLNHEYTDGKEAVTLSASIGVAVSPDYGTNVTMLIQCADTALYESKKRGKNAYAFFDGTL